MPPRSSALAPAPARAGVVARRWGRFERDLGRWLESPDGRFASWSAQAAVRAASPGRRPV